MSTTTILVIEDEESMRAGLVHNLEYEGYEVRSAADGPSGLEAATSPGVDLIVLDVMMPGMDGFELLGALRDQGAKTPVILLTAKALEEDKLEGFRLGADDYVTKPFSVNELVARIQAVLSRVGGVEAGLANYTFHDVVVDFEARVVRKGGEIVEFSLKELEILRLLIGKKGKPVTRAEMLDQVWGYEPTALPDTRTVDTHIARIRSKLGDAMGCPYIKTVHKVGYKFVD